MVMFEESIGTENELSMLHQQIDELLTTQSALLHPAQTLTETESSGNCTLESVATETESNSASTYDRGDTNGEQEQGLGRGYGRGRGHRGDTNGEQEQGLGRGYGRGRGHARDHGSGSVRGPHTSEQTVGSLSSLFKLACDISISAQHFKKAPSRSSNKIHGLCTGHTDDHTCSVDHLPSKTRQETMQYTTREDTAKFVILAARLLQPPADGASGSTQLPDIVARLADTANVCMHDSLDVSAHCTNPHII